MQKGSIGDDLYNSLVAAEKELEAEIVDVVTEANSFVENWGQLIFPTANEIIANEKMRALFEKTADVKADLGELILVSLSNKLNNILRRNSIRRQVEESRQHSHPHIHLNGTSLS